MTTNTALFGTARPEANGIASITRRAVDAFSRALLKRRTAAALAELEDYVLLDIGLNPSEVRRRQRSTLDWVVRSHSGTARLVFFGH